MSQRSEKDPELPPGKESGDGYIIAAAIIGAILGGAIGFLITREVAGVFLTIICIFGGVLVGGSAGGLLGEQIKKSKSGNRNGNGNSEDE